MTLPISIPNPLGERQTDLITFTVLADGEALPKTIGVVSIEIDSALNRIPTATILVEDGDLAAQEFTVSSSDTFVPGVEIEISAGYHSEEETLFRGVVTRQSLRVRPDGGSFLTATCRDPAFRMTLDARSRGFEDVDEVEIFEELVRPYPGVSVEFAELEPSTPIPFATQYRTTDWDYLITRAERLGLFCSADNGTLRFTEVSADATPVLELAFGREILAFDAELEARGQHALVVASAWDDDEQAVISGEADRAPVPGPGNLDGEALADVSGASPDLTFAGTLAETELEAWARAALLRSRLARVRGTVKCQGNGLLQPGTSLQLAGLGDRFNGPAYVAGVRHTIGLGDWTTTAQLGIDPAWHHERHDLYPARAGGSFAAAGGLQSGVVTQLADDPAGRQRIRVRLVLVDAAGEEGRWMRWSTPQAGENRGLAFRPSIGDEVLVGFLDDDPDQGVVLGALQSAAHPSPVEAADDNFVSGIVTASGLRVELDDEATALTLATPDGRTFSLDDDAGAVTLKDADGNEVSLSSSGISLKSASDISIEATGKLSLSAASVAIDAQTQLTAKSGATAEVSGSATLTLKGGLVQIN